MLFFTSLARDSSSNVVLDSNRDDPVVDPLHIALPIFDFQGYFLSLFENLASQV
jgi:isochorismate hydrolase